MFTLNCNGKLLVADKPLVMGIINSTPDSFYEESRARNIDDILRQAEKMLKDGADLLDIGGQSTRPGSERISAEAEMERVIPAIESLHYNFPEAIISVDTFYAQVAKEAVATGVGMVNDIGGGNLDKDMLPVIAKLNVPYVCMHMKGTPQTMQQHTQYKDVTREVKDFFVQKITECHQAGIKDMIIDPGFGFAKNSEHSFELLRNLSSITMLEKPVLIGISRKSFIYKTLGITAQEALNATTALHMAGLLKGVSILRVHDVKEAAETIQLFMLC